MRHSGSCVRPKATLLAIRQGLTAQDPDNAGWQRDLSVSQDNVGNVLRNQEDLTGALEAYRASLVQVDIVDTRNLSPTCHRKLKTEHNVHECGSNPLGLVAFKNGSSARREEGAYLAHSTRCRLLRAFDALPSRGR
jgi:hypothetical protein